MPSERDILTILVIGTRSESKQSLTILVGITSVMQVAFDDLRMIFRTSVVDAGENSGRVGGGFVGVDSEG